MSAAVSYPEPEREHALPRVVIFPPELRKLLLHKCAVAEEVERAKRATCTRTVPDRDPKKVRGTAATAWVPTLDEAHVDVETAGYRSRHHLDLYSRSVDMVEHWRERAEHHHAQAHRWANVAILEARRVANDRADRRRCHVTSWRSPESGARR